MSKDVERDIRESEAAFEEVIGLTASWREAAAHCLPRLKSGIGGSPATPDLPDPFKQSSVATDCLDTLASGMAAAICPSTSEWFQWQPAPQVAHDATADWLLACTKAAMLALSRSSFYSRLQEFLLDGGCIGTSAMMLEGERYGQELNFSVFDIGTYAIAEGPSGRVDRIWRKQEMTVQKAEGMFGKELPESLRSMDSAQKLTKKEEFLTVIQPREESEVGKVIGPKGMAYEACIIHIGSKTEVWDGGYEEQPIMTWRYLKQSGTTPWGTGPGIMSLPASRGLNFMEARMADAVGKIITPPLVIADNIRGAIDLRAGGITMVSDMSQAPKQIAEVGNVQVGLSMIERLDAQIKRFFHTSLFEVFTQQDKQMTRYEAMQIKDEKVNKFSQPFHRFTSEFTSPLLERLFMILFRQGAFPPPPPEAVVKTASGPMLVYPTSVQTSPMALAIKALEQQAFREYMADITPVAQIDQTVLDNVDFNAAARMMGRSSSALSGVIRAPEQVEEIRNQRAQAQAQQAQQAQMAQLASAAIKNPQIAQQLAGAVQQ